MPLITEIAGGPPAVFTTGATGAQPHLPGVLGWLLAAVLIYAVVHVLLGALLHPFHKARHEHKWSFGWSLARGPYVGRRIGHHGYISEDI